MSNDIKFTFGIITDGNHKELVTKVVDSINSQNIPEYQIIIVTDSMISIIDTNKDTSKNHYVFPYDFTEKDKWITKKKNVITQCAKYNNIVYMHDYIILANYWYDGFKYFGEKYWDICMTQILNLDKTRYRDWVIWADKDYITDPTYNNKPGVESNIIKRMLPPYSYNKTKNMYVSGAYFIAKKHIMQKFPFDESLVWGQGEDFAWSKTVLIDNNCSYFMNKFSIARLLKQKEVCADVI